MDGIPLVTSSTIIPQEKFWTSVLIYHDRPHLVNRKLAAISPVLFCKIFFHNSNVKYLSEVFRREALLYEIRKLKNLSDITPDFIRSIIDIYDTKAIISETNWDNFHDNIDGEFISVRLLLPRKGDDKCVEVVIFNKGKNTVTFFAIQGQDSLIMAPRFQYHLELTQNGNLRIIVNNFEDADTSSAEWLADKLFEKLLKWVDFDESKMTASLSLINAEKYCTLYTHLKSKYAENLIKFWSEKTNTDPQKYIFEDIAIATYLICFWEKIGATDINFVDCGCGNGLLVYILNGEGFKGCGYDIRARKVWDLYKDDADLKIGAVTPDSAYSGATWIIGNHSDELTPWIPIIALNSSPKTNFFVLPCCPYDLNGQKYVRTNTAVSQYKDYIEYVRNISILCGFTTSLDRLRIPSTKRTCLIGLQKEHDETERSKIKQKVSLLIEKRGAKFIPREAVEKVRNCTQLSKELKDRIITSVVKELLDKQSLMVGKGGKQWNQGGSIMLPKLIPTILLEDRQNLKNECGGLQTLLKNHRYIFDVKAGSVSLRKPPSLEETQKYKDKPCWFEKNHPEGCLHNFETCAYKHESLV